MGNNGHSNGYHCHRRLNGRDDSKIMEKGIDFMLISLHNHGMTEEIKLPILKCLRCEHEWIPRQPKKPKYCAGCNSPYWNKPKWKGVKK